MELTQQQRDLVALIQHGLPICSRPYAAIADRLGCAEAAVIEMIAALERGGVIRRFGVVVRHHEVGYRANGMVVWDLPDSEVERLALLIQTHPFVTLCYQRPRRLPMWRYNLFSMIHGHDREEVRAHLAQLQQLPPLQGVVCEMLFSRRRFKQRGAHYLPTPKAAVVTLSTTPTAPTAPVRVMQVGGG